MRAIIPPASNGYPVRRINPDFCFFDFTGVVFIELFFDVLVTMFLPPMVWFKIERVLRLMWVNFFRRLRLKGEFMRVRESKKRAKQGLLAGKI
jgi:hypothetical protein